MSKSKSDKIEILSITFKSKGKIFTTKPIEKKAAKNASLLTPHANTVCTPGDTKCENGELFRCFDIGNGQSDWLTAGESC